jgi:hypothetical protein
MRAVRTEYQMRLGDRIALISIIVLSSVIASVATNDIRGNAIAPQNDAARAGDDTKTKMANLESAARRSPMRDVEGEQRDEQPPALALPAPAPPSNDLTRYKTLAVLILMLRDGRGAR